MYIWQEQFLSFHPQYLIFDCDVLYNSLDDTVKIW